jgi:hypothetical protein
LGTLQTHWEVLQDLRNTHNNLERTNLSAEERADLANTHRLQSDRLIWLERWNKHLAKQTEPNLSQEEHARLEIWGATCKMSCKILEKIQQDLNMQNCTNLPERAQANWRQIYDLGLYLTNLQHDMENSIFSSENLGGLRYKHKLWANQFERLERSFNALEKYSEVQEKLQHTQDELMRTNLSQAERANLQNSCWVLQAWKKNLDSLAHSCRAPLVIEMATKLSKTLEQFHSYPADSDLSPKERAKQKTSRWILKKWHKNLEKYTNKPSTGRANKCNTLEKLYDAWETGKTNAIRRQLIMLQQKATQYRKRFVNAYWEMLCQHS